MSQSLPVAAAEIDWKLVASAGAVFVGTIVTTVWGWMQGRKKSQEKVDAAPPVPLAAAVLQDNASLRDNTMAVRELRDQVFLLSHVMERHVGVQNDIHNELERLIRLLDKAG